MNVLIYRPISLTALLLASAVPATWAHAQGVSGDASGPQAAVNRSSDDIIITARRTEERLQDVPVSVTAIGAADLEAARVESLTDIQQLAPSVNITPLNGVGTAATVSIRGQVQTSAGIGVDPSVGVYINEVYNARPANLDSAVFDVSSVQILRGPQGTLFGRNSVGGALLIETRRPGADFGGYIDASVEDPFGYNIEAALNMPLGEQAGLRIAGLRQYVKGYSRVVGADYRLDDTNRWSGRVTLDATLGALQTTFIADGFRSRVNGPALYPLPPNPALMTRSNPIRAAYLDEYAESLTRDYWLASQDQRTYGHSDTWGISNISTVDLTDNLKFKNIAGYRWQKSDDLVNHDALAANLLYTQVTSKSYQLSEEFQFQASLFEDTLDLIAGGYFFQERGYDRSNSYVFRAPTSTARGQNRFTADNTAISAFAHASWQLPIDIPAHLFGGVRETRDTREMFFESRNVLADGSTACTVSGAGPDCKGRATKTFPATTWDVGIDIKPIDEIMLYGTIARGYRTGGFNGRATGLTQQLPFFSEYVTSYEAGLKAEWYAGGVRGTFNVSGFYSDYTDIQRITVIDGPSGLQSSVGNAASATVQGVEVEAAVILARDVRARAFYSFIDPKYNTYLDGGVDRSDNEFPFVPRNQAGATLDWVVARMDGGDEFGLNASWSYRDGYFVEIINSPTTKVDSYHLFNASARWDNISGSGISAELYAENLFDKKYDRGGFSVYNSLGTANVIHGAPRVVGVSIRVPFGAER